MKKIFLIVFMLSVFVTVSQNLTYSVVSNNPETGFFVVNIDPWNVLASQSRLSFSGQAGMKLYKSGFYLNLSGDFHYIDNLASSSDRMFGQSIYEDQKSRNVNALVGYLISWKKNGPIKFHLKSGPGTGGKRVDTYGKVNIDYKQYFGLEGGIRSGYSFLTYKGEATLNGKDYYSNSEVPISDFFTTYMQYSWVQCGFTFGKIINSEVNFSGYGNRTASYMTKSYAHLILPISNSLEDIYFTPDNGSSTLLTYRYILNDAVPLSKIGFRAGYEFIPMKKLMGVGLEIGTLPGIKNGGNFYISTKLSFNFGARF
jgi:hypothetical protein